MGQIFVAFSEYLNFTKLAPSNCGHPNAYFLEKMAQLMTVAVNYRWVAKNPSLASGSDIIVDADSLFAFHLHIPFSVQFFVYNVQVNLT